MANRKCKAKRRDSTPCPNSPGESGYCFTHDPARGAERAAARKRGGQHRRIGKVADPASVKTPIRDIPGVLVILDVATLDTLAQENSAQRSRALTSIALAYLKALEVGEMEARLEVIEQALKLGGPKDEFKARLDKANAELKERLLAEWRAAARPVIDLTLQAPEAEQAALWRAWGKVNGISDEQRLDLCGGVGDPQPGDAELLASLDARIPPEMMWRLSAAAEAARAAGVED